LRGVFHYYAENHVAAEGPDERGVVTPVPETDPDAHELASLSSEQFQEALAAALLPDEVREGTLNKICRDAGIEKEKLKGRRR
jgi:hypothetical protein